MDLSKKEQFKPDFLKLNPAHCVPTLIDEDGTVMWESRAVAAYLIDSKSPGNSLYPKDARKRLAVDQSLYFSATYLNPRVRAITVSHIDIVSSLFTNIHNIIDHFY